MRPLIRLIPFARLRIPAVGLCALFLTVAAAECRSDETNVPARIELRDQHDKAHAISFPGTRITVLCLADRKGREQSGQWTATLAAYKERAAIHAIADAGGTPEFMKKSVRKKIQASHKHDLLIDWTGATCSALGCARGVANLMIVSLDGTILHRTTGAPTAENVKAFAEALDRALALTK